MLVVAFIVGCGGFTFGRDEIFDAAVSKHPQIMETYPLERQWRVYLYGQQRIHPPELGLAEPIAKQGKVAADYVVEQLSATDNELDHVSSLWLFHVMRTRGYFDICGNPAYLTRMQLNENKIQRAVTREYYREGLARLCKSTS